MAITHSNFRSAIETEIADDSVIITEVYVTDINRISDDAVDFERSIKVTLMLDRDGEIEEASEAFERMYDSYVKHGFKLDLEDTLSERPEDMAKYAILRKTDRYYF